MKYTVLLVIG